MNDLSLGIELMVFGLLGVFSVLIIFYVLILLLVRIFPDKTNDKQ